MLPRPVAGCRGRLGRACVRQGSSADACGCRTRLKNAHGTVFRELLYPWHPWSTMRVAVHEAIGKTDGYVFRCTLSGLDAERWLEVPAWMFERTACPDPPRLVTLPFVSMSSLTSLSDLIGPFSKNLSATSDALPSGASGSSHDQNRRKAHDHADIGATVTDTGAEPKAPTKRRSPADRSVRGSAVDSADTDARMARVTERDQNLTHQPADTVAPRPRAGKRRRIADGDQP